MEKADISVVPKVLSDQTKTLN